MASETVNQVISQINATINETVSNNSTEKVKSTPEGMLCAYGSLITMALIPIFFGSFRSVLYHKQQKVFLSYVSIKFWISCCVWQESGEQPETMSRKDAAMFPIIASGALFGLYVFFKVCPMEPFVQNCDLFLCESVVFKGIHKPLTHRLFLFSGSSGFGSHFESNC